MFSRSEVSLIVMKILIGSLISGILAVIMLISCNQHPPAPLNPNGDSELAVLMREMYEDGLKMKAQVKYGGMPTPGIDHTKMITAEATEPEKVATEEYKGFTDAYLNVVHSMKKIDRSASEEVFTNMVDMCKSCHQSICPGPIVKIDKLYLDAPFTEL